MTFPTVVPAGYRLPGLLSAVLQRASIPRDLTVEAGKATIHALKDGETLKEDLPTLEALFSKEACLKWARRYASWLVSTYIPYFNMPSPIADMPSHRHR